MSFNGNLCTTETIAATTLGVAGTSQDVGDCKHVGVLIKSVGDTVTITAKYKNSTDSSALEVTDSTISLSITTGSTKSITWDFMPFKYVTLVATAGSTTSTVTCDWRGV